MVIGRAKALSSVTWSAVEGGGLSVISFLSLVAFSRVLAPSDFGLFATALSLLELMSLVCNLAFHDALVQIPVLTERHKNTAFTVTLGLSVLFSGLFWVVSPLFSFVMHSAKAGPLLGVLSFVFILNGFSATLTAQQRRDFNFRTLAIRSLVGRLAGAGIGLASAFFGAGVWSLVIQQLCMAALSSAILWAACEDRPRFGLGRAEARQLVVFGFNAAGSEFVNTGLKRVFVMACGVLLGVQVTGYVNLAFRVVDTLWGVSATAIYQVILPIMSRMQDDRARLVEAFRRAQTLTCLVLFALYMGLAAAAPAVVTLLFGARWLPAAGFVTPFCFMMLLQAPRMLTVPALVALGRPKDILHAYLAGVAYLILAIVFVRFSSAPVVVAIWVGTEVVYAPIFAFMLYRGSGVTPWMQLRNIAVPLIASGALYGGVMLIGDLLNGMLNPIAVLAISGGVGGLLFLAVVALLDRETLGEAVILVSRLRKRPLAEGV